MAQTPMPDWQAHAERALHEDRASEDATTQLVASAGDIRMLARFRGESRFVLAGLPIVEAVFEVLDVSWRDGAMFHSLNCGSPEDMWPLELPSRRASTATFRASFRASSTSRVTRRWSTRWSR